MYDEAFLNFINDFHQDILSELNIEEFEQVQEDVFTQKVIDYLIEFGEIDDGNVFNYSAKNMKINGCFHNEDLEVFDVFISKVDFDKEPKFLKKTILDKFIKNSVNFINESINKLYQKIDESSEAFDFSQHIYRNYKKFDNVRIFILTDALIKNSYKPPIIETEDFNISINLWDIKKIYNCCVSKRISENLEIDFIKEFGKGLEFISPNINFKEYETYLVIIPGDIIADLYDKYGLKLLEKNVRSFLQLRGKVNKGINKTIEEEPQRFLAYNNGISVTANSINIQEENGKQVISKIKEFQIVNGGQTTASLFHSRKKNKTDLTNIFVQEKITVLKNKEKSEEIIPKISEYSNSQNKVNSADFSANDPFHIEIEKFSRKLFVPSKDGSSLLTKWYYERVRGQYNEEKNQLSTLKLQKQFTIENPKEQKFNKTDLAKYENTWNNLPYWVSKGAQKNFGEFTLILQKRGKVSINEDFYKHLIAKAILFKTTDKIIKKYNRENNIKSYKANIITYTLSYLFHKNQHRIDLNKIWKEQSLSEVLKNELLNLTIEIRKFIVENKGQQLGQEFCKKKSTWDKLIKMDIFTFSESFKSELININKNSYKNQGIETLNNDEEDLIKKMLNVTADDWKKISKWAKETNNLESWQRGIAFSIGQTISRNAKPTIKQAIQGEKILKEVKRLGFIFNE